MIMFESKIKHYLPSLYSHILPKEILDFSIHETKTNCNDCTMSHKNTKNLTYNPNLKCCTYYPYLPNFLVGAILSDNSTPQAQNLIRNIIKKRKYALPIGLVPPIKYQLIFNKRKKHDFGNDPNLLCPYFNKTTNNCQIWKYRDSVCSTFFCFSDKGKKGILFWEKMNDYLTYVEMALMEEALVLLDFSPRQMSDLISYLNRETGTAYERNRWNLPQNKAKELWNGYFDDQELFFKKCFQIVNNMSKKDFNTAMGLQGEKIKDSLLLSIK